MGFTWCFWYVQEPHLRYIHRAASGQEGCVLKDGTPGTRLRNEEAVLLPYCDNLNV